MLNLIGPAIDQSGEFLMAIFKDNILNTLSITFWILVWSFDRKNDVFSIYTKPPSVNRFEEESLTKLSLVVMFAFVVKVI